ncbi:MAG: DUF882 domain-containing protein [Bradyrhizobium sp.]|uniref:DUF882 domain-containing protein n=1 Tax=Bradyrhizobium sp. TaxID=376 RepID=UPI001C288C02|nr:DUF882 domain-containing protein [Bradyrhizobium sp.]MBU6463539.1 DUF882 domain-containing protein [Pseudomonadota bacterium]MDE2068760.1 DUF882 domain-containing protein [Bradyrhizobium sp.]MDE2243577.1 DUF882 domain-containing protein [Bradyrhizobium sp.]MDE2468438.1 DUF882 domain-containing protein [Bradyrhizobium sp.]
MLAGFARQFNSLSLPKAGYLAGCRLGLALSLLLAGAGAVHDATAENETRTLSFHHTHSNEDLTVTFKRNGRYDEAALKELNHYLRDWRTQDQTVMDPHLFDIIWEVYRDVGGQKPIQIISAYRAPATNAMLHRRSSSVARFSQHMLGHAMDFFIPGVPLEQIRFAGLRLQRGGVGFYPTSGSPFVHLDTGSIRHWPGMTHDQLVKVFPDGRTVHIPSDGVPLKGYELARADIEARDGNDNALKKSSPSLWAALFKHKSNDDDEDEAVSSPMPTAQQVADAAAAISAANKVADAKSAGATPRAKPGVGSTFQLASADALIVQPTKPQQPSAAATTDAQAETKAQTPADIINARGFWGNIPTVKQASPEQKARRAVAAADPQPTGGVSSAFEALAYAPAAREAMDRANIVTASAPIPHSARLAPRNAATAAREINTVAVKGVQSPGNLLQSSVIMTSARLAAAKGNDLWLRVELLASRANNSMFTTVLGDPDMTLMRAYFVKPQAVVAMKFSDDPQMGLLSDRFTGSATTRLTTTAFVMQTTASLH